MKKQTLRNTVMWSALITFGILIIWLFGKYLFEGILPFLIAYPLSLIIRPASSFLAKKTKLKRNFCCAVLVLLSIIFAALVVSWLVSTLIAQSRGFITSLATALEEEDNILRRTVDYFANIKKRFPFISNGTSADAIYDTVMNTLGSTLTELTSSLASLASQFIVKLPGLIFSLITAIIALFYFSMDKGEISLELKKLLGSDVWEKICFFKNRACSAFSNYLKSYMIIMLITFAELFLGFILLRIDYPLLLAFLIAIVDILPVLGAGTVILPLGLLYVVTGDLRRGIGLIVLWIIMYIIRQITEPHVLGSVMGIHPIISLFSIYLGFVLFGVGGMLFLPLLTYVLYSIFTEQVSEYPTSSSPKKQETEL